MKKVIITIIASFAAAALIVVGSLAFAGEISFSATDEEELSTTRAAYVEYMDMYLILNDDGIILESALSLPEDDIPEITGFTLGNVITGKKLDTGDETGFEYVLDVVNYMRVCNICGIDEVYISSGAEVTVYAKDIKILLGENEDTSEKISDLKDFYYTVAEMSGTLDMQEVSESNTGYTFKVSSE